MNVGIRAARSERAMQRIAVAGARLGQRFPLSEQMRALLGIQGRDREVVAMKQREAVAGLLEAIETATRNLGRTLPEDARERLLAIKGIGPGKAVEILQALGIVAEPTDDVAPDVEG